MTGTSHAIGQRSQPEVADWLRHLRPGRDTQSAMNLLNLPNLLHCREVSGTDHGGAQAGDRGTAKRGRKTAWSGLHKCKAIARKGAILLGRDASPVGRRLDVFSFFFSREKSSRAPHWHCTAKPTASGVCSCDLMGLMRARSGAAATIAHHRILEPLLVPLMCRAHFSYSLPIPLHAAANRRRPAS